MDELTLAKQVGAWLLARGEMLVTAESCTGGGVARAITEISGSSAWFDRGFITYSNAAKHEMLGVLMQTLECEGAVSEATVREMAEGALANSRAQISLAVSGIAGPGGGSAQKPVGTVCFAWCAVNQPTIVTTEHFRGDRAAIRQQSVVRALRGVLKQTN